MECPVDPNMEITAVTNAKWWGAPGPLKCGPKSEYPFTGTLRLLSGTACVRNNCMKTNLLKRYEQGFGIITNSATIPGQFQKRYVPTTPVNWQVERTIHSRS